MRFIPFVAALLALSGFLYLGNWQLDRAAEKQTILDRVAAGDAANAQQINSIHQSITPYSRVRIQPTQPLQVDLLLDAQTLDGKVGYHALAAAQVADGAMLVNLGWLNADQAQTLQLPQRIEGLWSPLPAAGMQMGQVEVGQLHGTRIVNYPSAEQYAQLLGQPLAAGIVLLDAGIEGGYARQWKPAGFGPDKHYGYAVTWFAFAATVVVLFFVLTFRSLKHDRP